MHRGGRLPDGLRRGVPAAALAGASRLSPEPERLRAGSQDAGLRLDAFLAARGAAPSRAAAQRLIDGGRVSVDGRARPKNHRLGEGELVELSAGEPETEPGAEEPAPFEIVHLDDQVVVVDKPAGVVTHPAPGHDAPTLAEALAGLAAGGDDPERAGLVHRLDRDTSGLLVVARTDAAHSELRRMMQAREISRAYVALVSGRPDTRTGTIDAPIGRDRTRRTVMSTRTDVPRAAVTHFEVLERLPRTALLDVRLETGRTHQIRAHFAAIDHPVCGDAAYGGAECGRRLGLTRQFLHARTLMFRHPSTGELVTCESKPPADLRHALDVARREPVSGGPDGG